MEEIAPGEYVYVYRESPMTSAAQRAKEIAERIEACLDEVGFSLAGNGSDTSLAIDIIAAEIESEIQARMDAEEARKTISISANSAIEVLREDRDAWQARAEKAEANELQLLRALPDVAEGWGASVTFDIDARQKELEESTR